jgi:hypothetical protein
MQGYEGKAANNFFSNQDIEKELRRMRFAFTLS